MLAFYDPNKKCILVTDACDESHDWRNITTSR